LVAYGGTPTADLGYWMMMLTMNVVSEERKFILYSIQTLKRLKPDWFHEDLALLFDMLKQGKIKPLIAARIPLNQASQAHELLAGSSVKGKIVLICND
jgi:NADPH:quinone reductase-like Zn-dependent oxidoreductase